MHLFLRLFVKPSGDELSFPFEWAFAGTNETVKVNDQGNGVVTQDFNFWLDTNVYLNVPNTHRGEVNTTWKNWDSGCVEETGAVYPFGADKESVSFRELWQPVDPSREDLVIVSPNNEKFSSNAKVYTVHMYFSFIICNISNKPFYGENRTNIYSICMILYGLPNKLFACKLNIILCVQFENDPYASSNYFEILHFALEKNVVAICGN